MTHDNDLIRRCDAMLMCDMPYDGTSGDYWTGQQQTKTHIKAAIAAIPAVAASQTADPVINAGSRQRVVTGWVIANGQNNRWRCVWKWETNAEWTDDISKALKFATRDDAEAFSADDEDAWLIQEVPIAALDVQPNPRDAQIAALMEALNANIMFAENIADALDVDPDETCLNVRVMPEGREVASKSWADVMREGRAALAAVKGGDA